MVAMLEKPILPSFPKLKGWKMLELSDAYMRVTAGIKGCTESGNLVDLNNGKFVE